MLPVLALLMFSSSAYAGYYFSVSVEMQKDGGALVVVNGKNVVLLKTNNGDMSPKERAEVVAKRLKAVIGRNISESEIGMTMSGSSVRVTVNNSVLVIATKDEAKTRGVTSLSLASGWVQNLRSALSESPLMVETDNLLIPRGEARGLKVCSVLPDRIKFSIDDESVAVPQSSEPGRINLKGLAVGDTRVYVSCGEWQEEVRVSVREYAAYPPSVIPRGIVTGVTAPADLVKRSAKSAILNSLNVKPGAAVQSVEFTNINTIYAAHMYTSEAIVEVSGTGYIPARLKIPFIVENRPVSYLPPTWTMYSNDPESVKRLQTLYGAYLYPSGESFRVLYHHQNAMSERIGFVLDVINSSDKTASFQVIEGIAPPMLDTVIVGYKAGMDFMENRRNRIGRVIELPPYSRQVLVSQSLGRNYTASGLMELRQLTGDPLLVRVTAEPDDMRADRDQPDLVLPSLDVDIRDIPVSTHVYNSAVLNVELNYRVGDRWLFYKIGDSGIKNLSNDKQLHGNYGVTYDIRIEVENPTDETRSVEILFEASAGPASGVFSVDGEIVKVRYLVPPAESRIGKVTLPPGGRKTLSVRTIPLSGSSYPAKLIVKPAGK